MLLGLMMQVVTGVWTLRKWCLHIRQVQSSYIALK